MKAENERLRRDNERFVRLIDSGEWGRGRVAELTQAGESSHALPWGDALELMPAVDSPVAVDFFGNILYGFHDITSAQNTLLLNMGSNAGFCLDMCVHMSLSVCLTDCLSVCLSGWLADCVRICICDCVHACIALLMLKVPLCPDVLSM